MDEPMVSVNKVTEVFSEKDKDGEFSPPVSWWYQRAEAGDVPSYKLGKYRRFRLSEVARWIETKRQGARPA